ncbi:DUF2284 domain-containing protein [Eubacterium callanderi]|uniref:DUF2284 domain-containing protein n=1 Tax=Eubacterium callanderi TaxID=53442 RepID=UPI001C2CEDD2|nr:DUF2284 domain-containing protein [Eubacterium callanderi]MBV1684169.1 DUF2284 domain-containing protein [Eubacterium callanderi]
MNGLNTTTTNDKSHIIGHPAIFAHPSPREMGVKECAFTIPNELTFSEDTRILCKNNSCGLFDKTWACPPAVGSYERCVAKCLSYSNVLIFSTATDLKGRHNPKGWYEARVNHEAITARIAQLFRAQRPDCLVLSTEGCLVCDKCTYPDKPCPHPDKLYPSVESYGIVVMDIVSKTGLKYTHGKESLTYFSFILF